MSEIHWLNPVSGNFTNAADWSGGVVPGPDDDALLDAPGSTPYTVTVSSIQMLHSIQTSANATLAVASGYVGDADGTGTGANAGVILVGADATFAAGGEITNSGLISLYGANSKFFATNQVTNSGTIAIAGGANGAEFLFKGAVTLSGGGQVILGDGGKDQLGGKSGSFANEDNTISGSGTVAGLVANGASGVIDATGARPLMLGATTLANAGLLEARASGGLIATAVSMSNDGTIEASGAGLTLTITTMSNNGVIEAAAAGACAVHVTAMSNAGSIEATGGGSLVIGPGTILNESSGLVLAASGSTLTAQATISGGTLQAAGSGSLILSGSYIGTVTLKGTIDVEGTMFRGAIKNTGVIELDGAMRAFVGDLTGGGTVQIQGGAISAGFINAYIGNQDNTIVGSGQISGEGDKLYFTNAEAGFIDADAAASLTIGAGSDSIFNAGTIECSGAGGLIFGVGVQNTGTIVTTAGTTTIDGAVTGTGVVDIGGGTLAAEGSFNEFVLFTGETGTLVLGKSQSFAGAIIGFSKKGKTRLDLLDIGFGGGTEASYSGGKAGGVLTVTDQKNTAHINLQGDYLGYTFSVASDGEKGVLVVANRTTTIATPIQGFIDAMAGFGGSPCDTPQKGEPWLSHPLLFAMPRSLTL